MAPPTKSWQVGCSCLPGLTRRAHLCECFVKYWEEKEKKPEVAEKEKTKGNEQETRNHKGHDQP